MAVSSIASSPQAPIDPSLTLTRTQHLAMEDKAGNRKPLTYEGFASPCNALRAGGRIVSRGPPRFDYLLITSEPLTVFAPLGQGQLGDPFSVRQRP